MNIIQIEKALCQIVVVGILTDEAANSYKRQQIIPFEERIRIVIQCQYVDLAIPQPTLSYRENLRFVRPNYLFHGKDWLTGVQSTIRKESLETMKTFEGVLIEPDPYEGVSTTEIIHHIKEHR